MDSHRSVSRRGFLTAVAGTAATATVASTPAAAQASFGGWMSDVGNYEEVVDATGQDEVTVTVGAEGNSGAFAFDPPAVQIDTGATVIWEWTGEGGQHNVVAEEGGDFESELSQEAGFTFEHTFEEQTVAKYFCQPHRGMGMKGVVVAGEMPDSSEGGGGGGEGGGGGGGSAAPQVPDSAKSLAVALTSTLVSVLALAYFFIRYGGDYGEEFESA